MTRKKKLELTWIGKENRPKLDAYFAGRSSEELSREIFGGLTDWKRMSLNSETTGTLVMIHEAHGTQQPIYVQKRWMSDQIFSTQ